VRTAHLQAINLKRLENDYSPLPWDIDLVVLDGQQQQQQSIPNAAAAQSRPPSPSSSPQSPTTQRRTRTIRHPLPQPITQTRHSSRRTTSPEASPPRLSSHSLSWFHTAHERVLNDICGLCQEEYQDGERIVDLLCEHFYHERCVEKCFDVQMEIGESRGRKVEICCPLCRRRVVG